jgi:ATP-dependent RNA helicase DDX51/DBP6
VRHFKAMLRKADNTFVRDHVLPKGALEAVRDDVDAALDAMAAALAAETGQGAALLEPTQRNAAAGQAWAPQQQKQRPTVRNGGDGQAGAAKRRRVAGVPEFSLLAHPPADMAPAVTPRPPTVL